MGRAVRFVVCGLCVLLYGVRPAAAHPVPFSFLDLRLQPAGSGGVDASLVVHIFDLAHDLKIDPPERLLDESLVTARRDEINRLLAPRLVMTADGRTLKGEWRAVEILPQRQSVRIHITYALDGAPGSLGVRAEMFPYDGTHQTFVNVYEGSALTQAILDRGRPQFDYFAGARQGRWAVVRKFIPAGIHHI